MLVEMHMIQNHAPSNPNRDDLGAPKTAMFGGRLRARISSQCIKRSIRGSPLLREALEGSIGQRTVYFPDLVRHALEDRDLPAEEKPKIVEACTRIARKEEKEKTSVEEQQEPQDERPRTEQLVFLGPREVQVFVDGLVRLRKEMKKDYDRFLKPADWSKKNGNPSKAFWKALRKCYQFNAVDIALFGRMTTSPAFRDFEAAMQVAHAISTNELAHNEVDYFTAVDDLAETAASAYLDEQQFNSSTFYKYFSLDWDALVRHFAGALESEGTAAPSYEDAPEAWKLAGKALRAFIEAAAKTVPTGKRNSFANNNLPDAILVEVKHQKVPTSYANAFLAPAGPFTDRDGEHDMVEDSIRKLAHYAGSITRGFGLQTDRWWWCSDAYRRVPFMTPESLKAQDGDLEKRLGSRPPGVTPAVPVWTVEELSGCALRRLGLSEDNQ